MGSVHALRPQTTIAGKTLYSPDEPRWWISDRQRVVVLTFPSTEDAAAWDDDPSLTDLVEVDVL